MYEFVWWWMFALVPLPLMVRFLWRAVERQTGVALRVPFLQDFLQEDAQRTKRWSKWILALGLAAWLALVTAAARPLWIGEEVNLPVSGRDLMMVVDLSGSMQEQDFVINNQQVDRLTALKFLADDFIKKRTGDRIGLVLFADQAYLQAPLTFDRTTVRTLLDEAAIGLAGERTAIGDAIGLAFKHLQKSPQQNRVVILLTDGANTAGTVTPMESTEMAAKAGLKIYTVGIGSESESVRSMFGFQLMNPGAELDEKLLRTMASRTGGQYFRARNTEEFQRIYQELDRLEPVEKEAETWRPQQELFRWPLALAVLLGLLAFLLRTEAEIA